MNRCLNDAWVRKIVVFMEIRLFCLQLTINIVHVMKALPLKRTILEKRRSRSEMLLHAVVFITANQYHLVDISLLITNVEINLMLLILDSIAM